MKTIALIVVSVSCLLRASDTKASRETLKGIENLCVLVEDPGVDAKADGLTKEQIQTDVELRLRKAGLTIVPSESCITYLYVMPHMKKLSGNSTGLYAYYLEVSFLQLATVLINDVLATVPTWSTSSLGTVGSSPMARAIRDTIGDDVDKFLNAFLGANPK
jgi:hypothetical protein